MTLWFMLALMTAAAIFAVLWPLGRRTPVTSGSDVEVYRDQLTELDRDRANGLIGEREAEAARVEISRRLIAAADEYRRRRSRGRGTASPHHRNCRPGAAASRRSHALSPAGFAAAAGPTTGGAA